MPGGFFVYHADGDEAVVYVNEACLRIFGCADEEQFVALTGGAFPGMVHPEDIEAVEHSISRQIQADRYSMDYVEYRIIRRDGSVRWIEDYGHHVTLDAGEFFYVFINDATDKLRERADELEAVNAQLPANSSTVPCCATPFPRPRPPTWRKTRSSRTCPTTSARR